MGAVNRDPHYMKKISRNIFFFFIIAFIFFLGLAPRIFIFDDVQKTITEQISKNLDSAVSTRQMHWVWLPLPHLTLVNAKITNPRYELSLPKVKIYPSWRVILGEFRHPEKIILERPALHIDKNVFLPGAPPAPVLPEIAIIIKNGDLEIDAPEEYRDVLLADSLKFSAIRGRLQMLPRAVNVDIQASSPISKKITLQGNFTIPEKKYRFLLDCQGIALQKSVKALWGGRLLPVPSTAGITGTFTGRSLQHFEVELHGTLPAFLLNLQGHEIPLAFGSAGFKLLKSGPLLRLDINDLEVKDPQGRLSGHVERKLSEINNPEQPPTEPAWTLDITGIDLDLTAIRRKILALWPDNSVAKTVTDVVLAGRARSAAYRFAGKTADFNNLDAMDIEADVLDAAIHVPETALDLTRAGGPIQIKNSVLSGHGLSAQLANSFGRNAELLLGLTAHNKTFQLDIDIDADLADLPPVLAHLVNHDRFQRELGKFSGVSGKASGTLHLGNSLDHILTRVEVKNMQLATRYAPIPETVFIDSGTLQLEPEKVAWQKVEGRIGQQQITGTSGTVSWSGSETFLHIEELEAQLAGASLFAMLQQTNMMDQKISSILSSLDGTVKVTAGWLQGPALKPESWEYSLTFTSQGFDFVSPLLPEPAKIKELTAVLNQDEANIENATIKFLEQEFSLTGQFKHHLLEGWHGTIEFNGPVQDRLADWISSKGWFPEKLRPQIPCTMENLTVSWQGKMVAVSGIILHGLGGGRLPMARIDFEESPEHLRINELTFYAPGEQGRLELEFWRISPLSLVLSWEGFVNAATIDTLFQHSSFSSGNFNGAFTINYSADRPEATRFDGLLQAENLYLKTESSEQPIFIKNLDIKGIGRLLRIPALELDIGPEKVSGSGQLAAEKEGLQLDISLASSFLSKNSLSRLSAAVQNTQKMFADDDAASGLQIPPGWDITGRIGFDFDSFELSRITQTPYDEAQDVIYTFYDVHGDLQLAPDNIFKTEVFSAKLCGLDFSGVWYSDADLGQQYQFDTDPHQTLHLENVLPCLGVQQDIIEGEFSLQARLLKEADTWYDGNIYIKSSQGRILRLQTLSRIFKVVNITDLFEKNVENTGRRGFLFSQMNIDTHIHANNLIIDRAIIQGEGLNLFAQGEIHLDDYDADLTLLIAPFKTFDAIVSKVPIIGPPVLGESGSRVSIPVAVKGPIADPVITPMHPGAVGDALFNLVKDTFMLPYNILKPLERSGAKNSREDDNKK
jgi:hypothetical protein